MFLSFIYFLSHDRKHTKLIEMWRKSIFSNVKYFTCKTFLLKYFSVLDVICKNYQANFVAAKDLAIRPLATITRTTALAIGLLVLAAFATKWGERGSLYAFLKKIY